MVRLLPILTSIAMLAACGQRRQPTAVDDEPSPRPATIDPAPPARPRPAPSPPEEPTYVTGLEIRATDDSTSFGFAVVARSSPPRAAELRAPPPHPDAEDATGLLIGHRIATDEGGRGIGLAGESAAAGSYALPRDGLPGPIDVVVSRDGVIVALLELTPCDGCAATPIEGEISLVLPPGTIARLGITIGSRMFAAP